MNWNQNEFTCRLTGQSQIDDFMILSDDFQNLVGNFVIELRQNVQNIQPS